MKNEKLEKGKYEGMKESDERRKYVSIEERRKLKVI